MHGVPGAAVGLANLATSAWRSWCLPDGMRPSLEEQATYDPPAYLYSSGAHAVAVAVNPAIVEGQIRGGVVQGVGMALYEVVYSPDGQPSASYDLPTAVDAPNIDVVHQQTPLPVTPGGTKGVGESGNISSPVAVGNAVAAALPCYHTEMWTVDLDGIEVGVVGMAVGASFAVLVAEQLAASGAELVISITSAGQITELPHTPCFVLIEQALRDEGTSLHYQPPGRWSRLDTTLRDKLVGAFGHLPEPVLTGASWTTDAPYRETTAAIDAARAHNVACVEMEAAALYAYATTRGRRVVCLAHVTNTMATAGDDFDKGDDNGVHRALAVARAVAATLG